MSGCWRVGYDQARGKSGKVTAWLANHISSIVSNFIDLLE